MVAIKTENKLAALKAEYEANYATELNNVKGEIENALENLTEILGAVEEKDRAKILNGAKIKKLVGALGVQSIPEPPKKERKKSRTSRTELTEDAVSLFIGKGIKTKSELSAHFKGGNVKVVKFLDAMVKAKHLEMTMTKSKKNKDVTNYKVK